MEKKNGGLIVNLPNSTTIKTFKHQIKYIKYFLISNKYIFVIFYTTKWANLPFNLLWVTLVKDLGILGNVLKEIDSKI